jgi:octaprenyl-diphosphate synthase
MLSKGMLLCIENEDFDLLKIISVAVREISEGELLQIEKARKLDITEDVYYNIIRQKTATLLAACCAMGARTVQDDDQLVEKMRLFGEYIGMAFQIKDDLFDYGETAIGKPTGIDIKEQKMTLPLIYTLNNVSTAEKNWFIQSIKRYNRDNKRIKQVIEKVKTAGGLAYAEEKMEEFRQKALALLVDFPQDPYRDALEQMVNYVISRKQ